MRPMCKSCNRRPRAVLNHRYGRVYYRSLCSACSRLNRKLAPQIPRWQRSGYKMSKGCDLCGFAAKLQRQLMVYHRDGDLNNTQQSNLRTVCHNCAVVLAWDGSVWARGDVADK